MLDGFNMGRIYNENKTILFFACATSLVCHLHREIVFDTMPESSGLLTPYCMVLLMGEISRENQGIWIWDTNCDVYDSMLSPVMTQYPNPTLGSSCGGWGAKIQNFPLE